MQIVAERKGASENDSKTTRERGECRNQRREGSLLLLLRGWVKKTGLPALLPQQTTGGKSKRVLGSSLQPAVQKVFSSQ